jgi:sensor histidine kinase YesM
MECQFMKKSIQHTDTQQQTRWSLRSRLIIGFFLLLFIVSGVVTALFLRTSATMREEYNKLVHNSVEQTVSNLDAMVRDIYNVSDTFAAQSNDQLEYFIDRVYTPGEEALQKADTLRLYNQIFSAYDILQEKQKLGAIYTSKGVLYNFQDVNRNSEEVIAKLDQLDVNNSDHLMRFYWYPLMDNFLISEPSQDTRKDKIILGSRRVFSVWKSAYVCTHIFCIQEADLYACYQKSEIGNKGDIFILDAEGNLLSSSSTETVETGRLPELLTDLVMHREADEFIWKDGSVDKLVCVEQSALTKFVTVAVVPQKNITGEVDRLYLRIFMVLLTCMLLCCGMFLYLYRSFINPINALNFAMKEAHDGNLNSRVREQGSREIAEMMRYYNAMIHSINVHVVEKLEADRKEKELELEVLMSQINPHFLYNTLETIVWKSNEAGHPDIGRLAASLGRMFRLSVSGGQELIPLQQEIEHLMAYVNIQKYRYADSFRLDLRTDPQVVRKLYCLKIMIQPVVENSFLYGMEGLERQMIVRIRLREKDDKIELTVLDNGIGMSRERLAQVRRQIQNGHREEEEHSTKHRGTGIGLYNVAARITLCFGLPTPIHIYGKEGIGTITRIQFPKLTDSKNPKNNG